MASSLRQSRYIPSPQQAPKEQKASHLHVVLQPKQRLQVISSTPQQRFLFRLQKVTKLVSNLALLGLIGSAISYFMLISVEYDVNHNLKQLELQMKNREDLRSYLGQAYSWSNLSAQAGKSKMVEAKKVEVVPGKKTSFHNLFDFQN